MVFFQAALRLAALVAAGNLSGCYRAGSNYNRGVKCSETRVGYGDLSPGPREPVAVPRRE